MYMKTKGRASRAANEAGMSLIIKEIPSESGNVAEKEGSYTKNT
jgi:hypothetical protein